MPNFRRGLTAFAAMIGLGLGAAGRGEAAVVVDLELSLLVDVSGSVNASEFALQRDGYVNAFNNPAVVSAIQAGTLGQIAVNLVYWSGTSQQVEAVGWTVISDTASAGAFASAISSYARPFSGNTAPGSALNFATPLIFSNNIDSTRQAIDVSGDGAQNEGASTSAARNAALAAGVDVINGLVILGESGLTAWYTNNVIGGTNADGSPAFVKSAATFGDFAAAIEEKLIAEIQPSPVPEPSTVLSLGLGLVGVLAVGYRRRSLKTA